MDRSFDSFHYSGVGYHFNIMALDFELDLHVLTIKELILQTISVY